MHVGITGTRHGMTADQRLVINDRLANIVTSNHGNAVFFHHGCCQGADTEAAEIALRLGYRVIEHPGPAADSWRVDGKCHDRRPHKTHFARNRDIVNESQIMLATPAEEQEQDRGGTWYTIRYARKVGVPLVIVYPGGTIESTRHASEEIG